jgi:hypothetical protein
MGSKNKKRKSSCSQITTARNKFMCFACLDGDLDISEFEMFQHKDLDVSLCDTCYDTHGAEKWHNAGDWKLRDENNKCQFCEICGEGGTLLPCDNCSLSYCTSCLKYWLGEEKLQNILDDDTFEFNCFVCLKKGGDQGKLDATFPQYKKFREATVRYGNSQVNVRSHQIEEDIKEDLKSKKKVKQFKCYSCFDVKEFTAKTKLTTHAKFNTITCADCHHQLSQDDWTYTDQGKSEYCVLTGTDQGGDEIFVCDTQGCENVFCEMVLKHWLTKPEFDLIMNDEDAEFHCFICNPDQGNYKKFIKESENYMNAFKKDEDFTLGDETVRKLKKIEDQKRKKKEEKRVREERSSSKSSSRSSRKRAAQEDFMEDDSDEEMSAPKTRNLNLSFTEDNSEIESDPETDYLKANGDAKPVATVPTEKEAASYILSRVQSGAFNKKYHATEAYEKILKYAQDLK